MENSKDPNNEKVKKSKISINMPKTKKQTLSNTSSNQDFFIKNSPKEIVNNSINQESANNISENNNINSADNESLTNDNITTHNNSININNNSKNIDFLDFCKVLENISSTTKRLIIQDYFTDFLKKVIKKDKNSLVPILFLSNASIYPQFKNIELGIGDFVIQNVVADATGLPIKSVKKELVKSGDLGTIAMENRVSQLFIVKKKLSCLEVFEKLKSIANIKGSNSTNIKRNIMLSLINQASPLETKYLIRLFETKLKIGLALQTILICIENAFNKNTNDNENSVKTAFNKNPDFENLINLIFKYGINDFEKHAKVKIGIPLKPMLATPTKNLTNAFAKFEGKEFVSEYKYDGERVQIHYKKGYFETKENEELIENKKKVFSFKVIKNTNDTNDDNINNDNTSNVLNYSNFKNKDSKVFSRNNEEISNKYPDIIEMVNQFNYSKKSFILDGEVVAFADGKIQPFQLLATRKRKNIEKIDVHVCVYAFDLIYFDGKELLDLPLKERRSILFNNFKEIPGKFQFVNYEICQSMDDIDNIFKQSIDNLCEGLMIKSLDSLYRPSHRSNSWIKMKKDYLDNLGDSVDLIVIGAFYGKGKRTGTYGGFLLGCYNDETEKIEAVCKIGTGFSDYNLTDFYNRLIITADKSDIICNVEPDVWIKPTMVWEVKAASFSLSPNYPAGKADESSDSKGISLRFPRFIKERDDKLIKDSTTTSQLIRMYNEELNGGDEDIEDEFN